METAHELFIHELTDILDAEQKLVEALGKQAEECSRPDLKKAFQSHQAQTEKQVERLQQCFEILGEEPEETECKGIKGLIDEHDSFIEEEDPAEDLIDIFNVGAAAKVESYEILAYQSLIRLADLMEHTKVSKLLNQNLKEEQQTAKKMEGFANKLKPENLGMDDEEEEDEEEDDAENYDASTDDDADDEDDDAAEDEDDAEEADTSARKNSRPAKQAKPRKGRVA